MPVLDLHDAGHRDDDVEVGVARQHLAASRPHTRGVGGVDLHRVDTRVLGGDPWSSSVLRPPIITVLRVIASWEDVRQQPLSRGVLANAA